MRGDNRERSEKAEQTKKEEGQENEYRRILPRAISLVNNNEVKGKERKKKGNRERRRETEKKGKQRKKKGNREEEGKREKEEGLWRRKQSAYVR